jgi:hypothetical protein
MPFGRRQLSKIKIRFGIADVASGAEQESRGDVRTVTLKEGDVEGIRRRIRYAENSEYCGGPGKGG